MLHRGHCALWKTVDLPHLVGSAKFSSAELHESSLRVCITSTRGLFVYDIECNVEEDLFSFDLIWHYKPPQEVGSRPIASRGALGVTGNNVSWIQGDNSNYAYPVSFAMTGITDCTMLQPTVFQWHNKDTPALYSLGVFDFDEARGILVVGNAFGELSILDFSRSDPHHFAKCLVNPIKAAPCSEEELLPRVSIVITSRCCRLLEHNSVRFHLIPEHLFPISVFRNKSSLTHGGIGTVVGLPLFPKGGARISNKVRVTWVGS